MKISAPRGTLTTEAIQVLLNAAAARSLELKINIHICVMDSSAEIVGWLSSDGAPRIAATTAKWKAITAVNTGMSTADWKAYTASVPEEERKIIDRVGGYVSADGGVPVIEDGLVLGSIGISGADQERDKDVARYAVRALGEIR